MQLVHDSALIAIYLNKVYFSMFSSEHLLLMSYLERSTLETFQQCYTFNCIIANNIFSFILTGKCNPMNTISK